MDATLTVQKITINGVDLMLPATLPDPNEEMVAKVSKLLDSLEQSEPLAILSNLTSGTY
jgi:hypothetical protein